VRKSRRRIGITASPEFLDTLGLLAYGARRRALETDAIVLGNGEGRVEPTVIYAVKDDVAWITLNRPAVLNALDRRLTAELADAAEAAAADPAAIAVVVRGAGRAFSSGMDRTALAEGEVDEAFFRHWVRALNTLEDMGKIAICVLHGYSIGGGLQLALACDLRIATDDAVIGLGATRHGLIPDGAVLRLARIVGLGRAKELALLNDNIAPADALAIGLVNRVCAARDLDATLAAVLDRCREAAPTATAHTKQLLDASFHHDPRSLIEEMLRRQDACMRSWEMDEANAAWREKREARFVPPPEGRERR
jgi:enoyl-CoA hydratase/carnithine racemase